MKFNKEIIETVRELLDKFNGECIFAGSFGLKIRGLISRNIHDLDVITNYAFSRHLASKVSDHPLSDIFMVDGVEVDCVPFKSRYGIHVDLFSRGVEPEDQEIIQYDYFLFHGMHIKVESVKGAIDAKIAYIKGNHVKDRKKHVADLKELGIATVE